MIDCFDVKIQFRDAMFHHGLDPVTIEADGNTHRFAPPDSKKKSCWYVLTIDDNGGHGAFGDWRIHDNKGIRFSTYQKQEFTPQERAEYAKKRAAAEAVRKATEIAKHTDAAEIARRIWEESAPCTVHPYLEEKRVASYGLRVTTKASSVHNPNKKTPLRIRKGALVLPLYDANQELVNLQIIQPDGFKMFLPGGQVTGTSYTIPGTTETIYVCEGFATGASIHEATGATVIVALNAGNLPAVARIIQSQYPTSERVIAADNDAFSKDSKGDSINKGIEKALDAAWSSENCKAIFPRFNDYGGKPTDFNDLHVREGIDTVRKQLADATESLGAWALYLESECSRKYLFHLAADEYLTDLPMLFRILEKYRTARIVAPTGSGKTTLTRDALHDHFGGDYHIVHAMPTVILANQKATDKDRGIDYHVVKAGSDPDSSGVQFSTWNSASKYTDTFLSKSILIIDEAHLLLEGIGFRRDTILELFDIASRCAKVVYLTATPHIYSRLYPIDVDLFVSQHTEVKHVYPWQTDEPEKAVKTLHPEGNQTKLILERRKSDCELHAKNRIDAGETAGVLHADNIFSKERREFEREDKIDPETQYLYHSTYMIQGNDLLQHNVTHCYAKMLLPPVTARQYLGRPRNSHVDLHILKKGYAEKKVTYPNIQKFRDALITAAQFLINENPNLTKNARKSLAKDNAQYRVLTGNPGAWELADDLVEYEVYKHYERLATSTLSRYIPECRKYDLRVHAIHDYDATWTDEEHDRRQEIKEQYREEKHAQYQKDLNCVLNMDYKTLMRGIPGDTQAKKHVRSLYVISRDIIDAFTIAVNVGSSESKFQHARDSLIVEQYQKEITEDYSVKYEPLQIIRDFNGDVMTREETTLTTAALQEIVHDLCTHDDPNISQPVRNFVTPSERSQKKYHAAGWKISGQVAIRAFKAAIHCRKSATGVVIVDDITFKEGLSEECQRAFMDATQRGGVKRVRVFAEGKIIFRFMDTIRRTHAALKLGAKLTKYTAREAIREFSRHYEIKYTSLRIDGENVRLYEILSKKPLRPYRQTCPLLDRIIEDSELFFSTCNATSLYKDHVTSGTDDIADMVITEYAEYWGGLVSA